MSKLDLRNRPFRRIQRPAAINLPFPLDARIRLAQLSESTPAFGIPQPFRAESPIELQGYYPNMIAGTPHELQRVAEQVQLGTVDLSSVDHAVIALTRCGRAPLSDVERVVLWQTFGVPVYEVFLGLDNSILGYECELHEGWHLASNVGFTELNGELMLDAPGAAALHTALSGFFTEDECPCGRPGRRILNLQPFEQPHFAQRWAASA